ncbi:flagellar hook protein FlgE [Ferrimonas sediminum]|uniref:Flagellar hook protein FlgE n=1 Tax=Ferrimonas sediminum TaxID=718193 RepID=A0A1G8YSC2_9GAMM|nr:flagellar hook protein FlgE [Ferrimonas sediminum]SDK05742.1 flagellar hook protein FlgE [Ferrimonas sediminum]
MSFNISLSGLNAAQKDLDTTSNNIANVNTIGFKESRAEFADVYSNSLFTNSKTNVGSGVATSEVAQQFHQGSLQFTNNALDLAINGNGMFVTTSEFGTQDYNFTRAGAFKLNDQNFMVDSLGNYLMALPVNDDGSVQSVSISTTTPVQIPQTAGQPTQTSQVNMSMNLPAADVTHDPANFDAADPTTYNNATSVTVYDSLGEPHIMTQYFVKPPGGALNNNNQWITFMTMDDKPVNLGDAGGAATNGTWDQDVDGDGVITPPPAGTDLQNVAAVNASGHTGAVLSFDDTGNYIGSNPTMIQSVALGNTGAGVIGPGADGTQRVELRFDNPTQYASSFEVTQLKQDGATVGRLTNVEVAADGLIAATYSNGTEVALGKVALARFANEQGLSQQGNTSWKQSLASGEALIGEPNTGAFGSVNSAALEQSNTDLTTELVDLISAQRNFQANSRALDIANQLQQNILQIR